MVKNGSVEVVADAADVGVYPESVCSNSSSCCSCCSNWGFTTTAVVAVVEPPAVVAVVVVAVVVVRFNQTPKKSASISIHSTLTPLGGYKCQIVEEELTSSESEPELESERATRLRAIWRQSTSCTLNIP